MPNPKEGKIFNLETAIKIHIEAQKHLIRPQNSSLYNQRLEGHIKIMEKGPRDSKVLERKIAAKKQEKDRASNIIKTLALLDEIDSLERLYGMVKKY